MKYENPCAVVDMIIERLKQILLVKRKKEPFKGKWALPGGHLNCGKETLEEAAVRELREETSLIALVDDLELIDVYSSPDRDPRGHYITHVYVARKFSGQLAANDDAEDAIFFPLENLPELAFDHGRIINDYSKNKL